MRDPEGRGRTGARYSWATAQRTSALGVLALALIVGACAGAPVQISPGSSASATFTGLETGAAPSPSAAATPSGTSAPKRQESIAIGDDKRVVDLFEPSVPANGHHPLLILLHANGESPFVMEGESGIGVLAAREGLFVALPPARQHRWNAMISSGDPIEPSPDVVYVTGLIDRLVNELPIDPDRVFVAGFSMGAVLSERLACQAADKVAAVILNAGAPWSDECAPSRPVSILVMHGTADNTFRIGLAGEVVARWRKLDECAGEPVVSQLSDTATAELNEGCSEGTAVQYVRYVGSGHHWFADPDATEVLWTFIESRAKA